MASDEALAVIRRGVDAWNSWEQRGDADLSRADLRGADLTGIHLSGVSLHGADLTGAKLVRAEISFADLREARLDGADLSEANLDDVQIGTRLEGACLRQATFVTCSLHAATLTGADMRGACIVRSDMSYADLTRCDVRGGEIRDTVLREANFTNADLTGVDLTGSLLVETNFTGADMTGCRIYGISAWNLELTGTRQRDLLISREEEPAIVVDDLEVAQFIYLMLNNSKIRKVIDSVTSKAVLLLGRFTPERKPVLDALRAELRNRGYVPILFDFERPTDRDLTETVTLLARLARFIVADVTDASSIPKELEAIVPGLAVPIQPLLEGAARPFSMFADHWKYDWVLPVYRYRDAEHLVTELGSAVVEPSERKVEELARRRSQAFERP